MGLTTGEVVHSTLPATARRDAAMLTGLTEVAHGDHTHALQRRLSSGDYKRLQHQLDRFYVRMPKLMVSQMVTRCAAISRSARLGGGCLGSLDGGCSNR